jgi:hypothetical protein
VHTFPQFKKDGKDWWEVSLDTGDPVLSSVMAELQNLDLAPYFARRPWYGHLGNDRLFLVTKAHHFASVDFEAAPFLEMSGVHQTGVHKHLHYESPILVRLKSRIPPIGWVEGESGPICTQTIKDAMEAEGFVGFIFTSVTVEADRQPPEPLWEIWSDRLMPPMRCPLVDDDGNAVVNGDCSNGCYTAEVEQPPIYVYAPEDIAAMAGVDAALTLEDFGPKAKLCEMRRLLVSQRFRQWALKRKLKLEYVPVMVQSEHANGAVATSPNTGGITQDQPALDNVLEGQTDGWISALPTTEVGKRDSVPSEPIRFKTFQLSDFERKVDTKEDKVVTLTGEWDRSQLEKVSLFLLTQNRRDSDMNALNFLNQLIEREPQIRIDAANLAYPPDEEWLVEECELVTEAELVRALRLDLIQVEAYPDGSTSATLIYRGPAEFQTMSAKHVLMVRTPYLDEELEAHFESYDED